MLIPIGLAMLSLEFVWAERMLDKSLEQAQVAQEKAAQTTRTQRILVAIATVLAIAAVRARRPLVGHPVPAGRLATGSSASVGASVAS